MSDDDFAKLQAALDRMSQSFILDDDHKPVPVPFEEWAEWMVAETEAGRDPRRLAATDLTRHWVSTVFLGIDTGWNANLPPLCFETMVFGEDGKPEGYQKRFRSYDEAMAGHAAAVEEFRKLERETSH